jgi:dolichol-phosphate mannosyltransferase
MFCTVSSREGRSNLRSLVILPSYNEATNVLPLSREILLCDPSLDVLVVDDNSPDGTAKLVEGEMASEPRLHLLRRSAKLGLGSAYVAGFAYALARSYHQVLTMDCDYSHHPRYLPAILAAMSESDMVVGSRYVPGGGVANWPRHRLLLSRFANSYARLLLRLPVRDCTAGFRCYSREVLESVAPEAVRSSGYSFLEEMMYRVHRSGFRIREVPIVFQDRAGGVSKINQSEIYLAAFHVLATALRPPRIQPRRPR